MLILLDIVLGRIPVSAQETHTFLLAWAMRRSTRCKRPGIETSSIALPPPDTALKWSVVVLSGRAYIAGTEVRVARRICAAHS